MDERRIKHVQGGDIAAVDEDAIHEQLLRALTVETHIAAPDLPPRIASGPNTRLQEMPCIDGQEIEAREVELRKVVGRAQRRRRKTPWIDSTFDIIICWASKPGDGT